MAAIHVVIAVTVLAIASCLPSALATANGHIFPNKVTVFSTNGGYLEPEQSDPCQLGPSYWCLGGGHRITECNLQWVKNLGVCGYSSGICPVYADVEAFCKSNEYPFSFNGGLTNLPPGTFGWLVVAMYWPPGSCNSNGTGGGFCSQYTKKGLPASRTMQLHGMWPDFGSTYGTPGAPAKPNAPSFSDAYEPWPQYCSSNLAIPGSFNYTHCHVNGDLCPTTPKPTSQSNYDNCLVANNVQGCVSPPEVVQSLGEDFKLYAAGYLGSNGSFLMHEFTKHGSCIGGYLTNNRTAYHQQGLLKAISLRKTSAVVKYVEANRGKAVPYTKLHTLMAGHAITTCDENCLLQEIWFCYGHDAAGYPTNHLIPCGPGNYASDSCKPGVAYSNNCSSVIIADFTLGPHKVP